MPAAARPKIPAKPRPVAARKATPRKDPAARPAATANAPTPSKAPRPMTALPRVASRPFDPATGDWVAPAAPAPSAPVPDPDAPRRGGVATAAWVLLILDFVALGYLLVTNIIAGAILAFRPDSAAAEELRRQFADASSTSIALQSLLSLLMFGLIPFLWVLATRQKPWAGTRKYLRLDGTWRDLGKGVLLTVPVLLAVTGLLSLYVYVTEGADGFSGDDSGSNPAVDAIVEQLTLPLAFLVALCAGVGEELFFRGLLQKRLGVWGQAAFFGLAHSAGGYLPQLLFAAALGVLFGFLVQRGWPLWALMVTHFLYDFTLLAASLVVPDFG